MAAGRRWSDLSDRTRRLILAGAAVEGTLKIVALVDLIRRPADQVRGPRWAWGALVALLNAAGGAPLAYLLFGRRRPGTASR
jgi:Phospholipase_D-nuclease N-terminal